MKKIAAILLCAMVSTSTIIILGSGRSEEAAITYENVAGYGLGGLWNPSGPRESETCRIISPESLLRDNPKPLPNAVDNSAGLPPVGNQLSQGSCTAWAIGYYHATYIENRESPFDLADPNNQVSPAYLYNIANGGYDGGSYMSDVADLLISNGACSMAEMPYNAGDDTSWPDEDWIWVSGMKRKAANQNWLDAKQLGGLDALRTYLAAGNTATTGIFVWGNFDNIESYNNTYSSSERYGTNRGGHVVTICGYDDTFPTADGPGALRMVNSWGTGWGDAGYWWLSYEALSDPDICQSGWVMYLQSEVDYTAKVVAKARIDHEFRGDITSNSGLHVIAFENDEEVWSKPFLGCSLIEDLYGTNTQQHPFPAGRMAFDISEALNYMQDDFHIFVLYTENSGNTEGDIVHFEILNADWWCGGVSSYVPMAIDPYSTNEPEAWVYADIFEHVPIRVDDDIDFAHKAIGEFWEGNGTQGNPYVISDYTIDGTGMGNCIYVGNTTSHFRVAGCTVRNATDYDGSDYRLDTGIYLNNVVNGNVEDNCVSNNLIGILALVSSDVIVDNNDIFDNEFGLWASETEHVTMRRNCVFGNVEYGILNDMSSGNSVYHNDIIANGIQAYDDNGLNSWHNGYPSGGNYWSDYNGTDTFLGPGQDIPGSDGFGDTPYSGIDGGTGAQDDYPLMEPWAPPVITEFNIRLTAGWNLLSVPLTQADTSVESVLSSISGKWDVVKCYDGQTKTWNTYRTGYAQTLATLDHTMGVWLHATENCTLAVSGEVPASTAITLYAGWNLVGYPSQTERSVGDALWGTGADRAEAFQPESPYIMAVGPEYIMRPGEGYWVRVTADTTWVVDW